MKSTAATRPLRRRPIERMDHWRCATHAAVQPLGFKEWQHFSVTGGEVDVLLNFSLMNGVQANVALHAIVPRLVALVRDRHGWRGAIETFDLTEVDVPAGGIAARFGRNTLGFDGRIYEVDVIVDAIDLRAKLHFEPIAEPLVTEPIQLGSAGNMRWLAVPRLRANGVLHLDGTGVEVTDAAAYHDHDWGTFRWGRGFAWNWSVSHSENCETPWTITATQVTDQGRRRLYTDSLTLWRGASLVRSFRRESMRVTAEGNLRPERQPLRVPPAAWLAAPGEGVDIPASLHFAAEGFGDRVDLTILPRDYAQIAIPADADDESTCLLSETRADFSAHGIVHGEAIDLRGPALLEMLHVVR